ncbi:hypothetical protein QFZ46_001797 [Microbacterium murale]|uniref:Secreted protein n=1 Tax=Microbacterium murale TaxID=1081040 RepID=A0ABU0P8H7_9MICO|nr:hypothetical protein [Microbacterium murale]
MHWMRLKLALTVSARVDAAVVLARPGTDSSRMWPPAMSETSRLVRSRSWPTIFAEYASETTFSTFAARVISASLGVESEPVEGFAAGADAEPVAAGCGADAVAGGAAGV